MAREDFLGQASKVLQDVLGSVGLLKASANEILAEKILQDLKTEAVLRKASDYDTYYNARKQKEQRSTLKKYLDEQERNTFNCIPGDLDKDCCHFLIVFCYEGDSLNKRMEEMIYHVEKKCTGKTTHTLFVTTQWRFRVFNKHRSSIETLKKQGVQFEFVLLGHFGAVRLALFH